MYTISNYVEDFRSGSGCGRVRVTKRPIYHMWKILLPNFRQSFKSNFESPLVSQLISRNESLVLPRELRAPTHLRSSRTAVHYIMVRPSGVTNSYILRWNTTRALLCWDTANFLSWTTCSWKPDRGLEAAVAAHLGLVTWSYWSDDACFIWQARPIQDGPGRLIASFDWESSPNHAF